MGKVIFLSHITSLIRRLLPLSASLSDVVRSEGLAQHIQKRHPECVQYLDRIPEILSAPDYYGQSPNEPESLELVKTFDKHLTIGLKIDTDHNYLFVATLYSITDGKLQSRLNSGRLKKTVDGSGNIVYCETTDEAHGGQKGS